MNTNWTSREAGMRNRSAEGRRRPATLASAAKFKWEGVILLALALGAPERGFGQLMPVPKVQWVSEYTHEEERSESGIYYHNDWDAILQTWVSEPATVQNLGAPQTREESGEDWHYGHSNFMENGEVTGVVTAGYSSWPN